MKPWWTAAAWQGLGWAAAAIGAVAYAVLAHRAASSATPGLFEAAVFIVPPMALALAVAWRSPPRGLWLAAWLAAAAALWLARDRLAAGTQWVLLLQHVGFNGVLGLGFARTLMPGSVPLVSRLAQVVHGPLSPRLARYTRAVTWAWVGYFAATAATSALLFALAPAPVWSAFVNLLSLPLLAAMFAAEYAVRSLLIPRAERAGFFQSVAAYRAFARRKPAPPR